MAHDPQSSPSDSAAPRPVVLCVLDGWGEGEDTPDNAILHADTPVWDALKASCPYALINASGDDVGLPEGQMGNSEVGHMNLGAGRVVLQNLPRIDAALEDGSLFENPALVAFADRLHETGGSAHLLGLVSPGGVHSHQRHIAALARHLAASGIPVLVHAFLDGRDTPPESGTECMQIFLAEAGEAQVATVSGRYFAMDRDSRWDRVEKAYAAIAEGKGLRAESPEDAIRKAIERGETDEFTMPTVIGRFEGVRDGDGILAGNFRADRMRELLYALLDPDFEGFSRTRHIEFATALGMTQYSEQLDAFLDTLFPPAVPEHCLGAVFAEAGLRQLRIAETEKYAHVTFFFNGGLEDALPGEERILVPSPKVATYDLKPEMSAPEVTDRLVEAITSGTFDFILVNYANTDMVGHTGDFDAAMAAVETIDACLGRLRDAIETVGGALLITADHGNAERMRDASTGERHTAHTNNLVPIILAGCPAVDSLQNGRLADIAPTVLELMGLAQPIQMTGESLSLASTPETPARRLQRQAAKAPETAHRTI